MNLEKLISMLEYRRPAFSYTEEEFIERFILPAHPSARKDGFNNIIIDTCENPTNIFSCHTDTVDHVDGFREVLYDGVTNMLTANGNEILGADDGAGVYILLEMIEHNKPGRYIFHRDEECGGTGAAWIADHTPELFDGIKNAIAFDRMGDSDVIDTMFNGKIATDQFVNRLCESLSDRHTKATGTFTDTALYYGYVLNCTNISVGYYGQHTGSEMLDLEHFSWLVEKVKTIDWNKL